MSITARYPLTRTFWRRIVPGLVVFGLLVSALSYSGARSLAEALYIEAAEHQASVLHRAVSHAAPASWQAVMVEHRPIKTLPTDLYTKLRDEFDHEVEELQLARLKVYSPGGHLLYATGVALPDKVETGPALREAVAHLRPSLVDKTQDTPPVYEIYVPILDDQGRLLGVFELYESADRLNHALARAIGPALGLLALFALLIAALGVVVKRAQRHMDERDDEIGALSRKLESFVSATAVKAAQAAGDIPSERVRLTLLYSDARDFTGYSEHNPPERVVWFLNELMTIQVNAVTRHGGDVDKMIGDALLARFQGPDAEANAIAAARDIQAELSVAALPRPVGIGLYTGDVISGAIGAEDRRDFTVIGDGVNVAARLCSAAAADEIVADADTLAQADDSGFGPVEPLTVKGRAEAVTARRLCVKIDP